MRAANKVSNKINFPIIAAILCTITAGPKTIVCTRQLIFQLTLRIINVQNKRIVGGFDHRQTIVTVIKIARFLMGCVGRFDQAILVIVGIQRDALFVDDNGRGNYLARTFVEPLLRR